MLSLWKRLQTRPRLGSAQIELTEDRLQRLQGHREAKVRKKGDEDPSFCLFSPRFDQDTPRTGPTPDLFASLVQQLEKTDDKSLAQIRALRESFTQSSLKNGFPSHRSCKDTPPIPSFADFEDMNLSRFDFMRNEVQLPETVTRDMNWEQVEREVLQGRAEELHSRVCGTDYAERSLELLALLEEREALQQRRDGFKREITGWLEG